MTLVVTRPEPEADRYSRPGGPWDVADLDTLLGAGSAAGAARLIDGDRRMDAAQLDDAVAVVAGGLRSLGVRHGDAVAWQLPNGTESVLLTRACWRLGAVAAPLHHRAGEHDLVPMLEVLSPAVVVAGPGGALADLGGTATVALRPGDPGGSLPAGDPVRRPEAGPADLALAQFTSGSTGTPKAVLHSHRTLAAKAVQMVGVHGLGPTDATLVQSPMSHIAGILNGVLVPQLAGMDQVHVARWDATEAAALVVEHGVTFMVGPPTVFHSLLDAAEASGRPLDSLRLVSCGGTGVTPEFVVETGRRLGAVVKRTYGCTEAPSVTTSAEGDPVERAASTDGHPSGATRVMVADPATGASRAPGEPGEIRVRGPELFAGYSLPAQTAAAMADGWFCTGDLGTVDRDGWLSVVGRIKDVIIRGGENISPAEVERILEQHPAVRQAVVIGVPDDRLGERVAAFVVASGDFDRAGCLEWFDSRGVARFKSPELVVRVDELPVLSLGKPDRAELARRARELAR